MYLLRKDGQAFGPFSEDEIKELLASGSINSLTEAALEGTDDWRMISSLNFTKNQDIKVPLNFQQNTASFQNQPSELYYAATNTPNSAYNPTYMEAQSTYIPNQPPTGVIVIGVFYSLAALGCLVAMIAGLFLQFGLGHLMSASPHHLPYGSFQSTLIGGLGAFLGILAMIFGALYGFIAYGLFTLRNWARIAAVVLSGLGLVSQLRTCLFLNSKNATLLLAVSLISTCIFGAMIYYLSKDRIKRCFS